MPVLHACLQKNPNSNIFSEKSCNNISSLKLGIYTYISDSFYIFSFVIMIR